MKRWIVNPVTSVVLLGILVADGSLLPRRRSAGGVSTVGRFVEEVSSWVSCWRARSTSHPLFYDALVVKEAGSMRVLQPNIESWDEATKLIATSPSSVVILDYTPREYRHGFWAITREDFNHEIKFVEGGTALTEADKLAARGVMLDALFGPEASHGETLRRLRKEDFAGTRILWPGVIHNVLSGAAFLLLLWSFRWVAPWIAVARERRALAALRRGVCPKCGYSITGLAVPVCPECGASLEPKDNDPGAGPGS